MNYCLSPVQVKSGRQVPHLRRLASDCLPVVMAMYITPFHPIAPGTILRQLRVHRLHRYLWRELAAVSDPGCDAAVHLLSQALSRKS